MAGPFAQFYASEKALKCFQVWQVYQLCPNALQMKKEILRHLKNDHQTNNYMKLEIIFKVGFFYNDYEISIMKFLGKVSSPAVACLIQRFGWRRKGVVSFSSS